jgi:aldehyde:ferredoxin oxidoreductase
MTEELSGKILEVDLNNQYFKESSVSKQFITHFLGGPGFAIDLLINEKDYQSDPLDKKNLLIFMT